MEVRGETRPSPLVSMHDLALVSFLRQCVHFLARNEVHHLQVGVKRLHHRMDELFAPAHCSVQAVRLAGHHCHDFAAERRALPRPDGGPLLNRSSTCASSLRVAHFIPLK